MGVKLETFIMIIHLHASMFAFFRASAHPCHCPCGAPTEFVIAKCLEDSAHPSLLDLEA